jgi:DNA repair protein RadC
MESNEKLGHKLKEMAENERPREKMLRHGASSLSYLELIVILIGSGNKNISALETGENLLAKVNNSLSELGKLTLKDLMEIQGIGAAKAYLLAAAMELGRRRREEEAKKLVKIANSRHAFEYLLPNLEDLRHEEFWILVLNRNNLVLTKKRMSIGGVAGTVVDPRIIFRFAIEHLASSIVLCHNHPSGNLSPSPQDIELTKKLVAGAKLLDIHIVDHIIIANNQYFSFSDEGLLSPNQNNY